MLKRSQLSGRGHEEAIDPLIKLGIELFLGVSDRLFGTTIDT
jgi:hypothetical protein